MTVGIDLGQFVLDPYGTGIQRVLQQLARGWPAQQEARFVVPDGEGGFCLLAPDRAAPLLDLPFAAASAGDLRERLGSAVAELRRERGIEHVSLGGLVSVLDAWLLPEVSYDPTVLDRLDLLAACMPVAMIGFDALPMTEPANYRFVPGRGADVSRYFRRLATADAVVCISEYARDVVLDRLRRDRALVTTVAHPGGDHVPVRRKAGSAGSIPTFVRLGTLEARKRPVEILDGFLDAVAAGLTAELVYIGRANASDETVNARVEAAIASGAPVRWVRDVSDGDVRDLVHAGDAFLSFGVEGYGIPVLEAIRLDVPVIFSGIQPAAQLMEGRGATRADGETRDALAGAFARWGTPQGIAQLRDGLDAGSVPTWRDFAASVAGAVASLA